MSCLNPLVVIGCGLGHLAGAAAGGLAHSALDALAQWWASAYRSLLNAFSSWFAAAGNVSILQYQSSGIWRLEVTIGMVVAAAGVIWAGARTAWTRSGEPLATALVGLIKAAVGTALIFVVVDALLGAANLVTNAIIDASAGSSAAFANDLAALSATTGSGGALLFLFALVGVVVTALLWLEMLIRSAGVIVVTMTAPIGAGGLVQESTAGWWRKLTAAELALVIVKPVIALVLAIGFTALHHSSGIQGLLVGLLVLGAAAFAWPAVARLFTFFGSQVASFGLGGALGFAGGLAASRGTFGNLAQGQPAWQTMELAGRRTSNPYDAPLGGPGVSSVGGWAIGEGGGGAGAGGLVGGAGDAGGAAAAGGGAGAVAGAGAVGGVAVAATVGKKVAELPGQALGHAGDLAGIDGGGGSSPMLEPPPSRGSGLVPPPPPRPAPAEQWAPPPEGPPEPPLPPGSAA